MRITAWNVEWLDHAWGVVEGRYAPGKRRSNRTLPSLERAQRSVAAVTAEILRIAPDVLFLCEAPRDPEPMARLVAAHLPGFDLVTRPAGQHYETRGDQWQWFLVASPLAERAAPHLLDIAVWRDVAGRGSPSMRPDGRWGVSFPRMETVAGVADVPVARRVLHGYYRHPQTLVLTVGGARMEIIGAHLKSKFTSGTPRARRPGEDFETYAAEPRVAAWLAGSHEARVKLSSEALNIRAYIDHRFAQEADPAILVLGDLNDGPGKELMEREYLLHDLISNLQGDVFFARRFLNHALFDAPQDLRWTVRFADPLEPGRDPAILLDHILFTQALTRSGGCPLWVPPRAGRVEHRIHEEIEAAHGAGAASDHRPVTLDLAPRAPA